jgi:hypothetical protein
MGMGLIFFRKIQTNMVINMWVNTEKEKGLVKLKKSTAIIVNDDHELFILKVKAYTAITIKMNILENS